jgi:hypothetical protein
MSPPLHGAESTASQGGQETAGVGHSVGRQRAKQDLQELPHWDGKTCVPFLSKNMERQIHRQRYGSVAEHLPCVCKALGSIPETKKYKS